MKPNLNPNYVPFLLSMTMNPIPNSGHQTLNILTKP